MYLKKNKSALKNIFFRKPNGHLDSGQSHCSSILGINEKRNKDSKTRV